MQNLSACQVAVQATGRARAPTVLTTCSVTPCISFLLCLFQEVDLETGKGKAGKSGNAHRTAAAGAGSSLAAKVQFRRTLQKWAAMAALAGIVGALAVAVALVLGWLFVLQLAIVAGVAWFVAAGGLRWSYVALRTAPRDVT